MAEQISFALGTFSAPAGAAFTAMILGEQVIALRDIEARCAAEGTPLSRHDDMLDVVMDWDRNIAALTTIAGKIAGDAALEALMQPISGLRVHAPIQPRQIFCAGANYRRHVVDMIVDRFRSEEQQQRPEAEVRAEAEAMMDERARTGEPYFFSRIASSVAGPADDLELPGHSRQTDWEIELGVVFKTAAGRISAKDAFSHIAGYVVVNDITNRDLTFRTDLPQLGSDWLRSKNGPGYFPVGPCLVPAAFVRDPQDLRLTLTLNGQVMQDETTADMIFGIAALVEHLTRYVRLLPGDILATGSPAGNGTHYNRYLRPGDVITASIEGLGTQHVRCISAP